ncbi:hypothetical protein [uncultured Kordia sp.]|uniref:hypothetical protein n=1 Tax=uncultured Kordia sp. TaxID=507699 RepID=UPI0026340BB8|nr:hypothetical protein [uncultured Kordia sp.]
MFNLFGKRQKDEVSQIKDDLTRMYFEEYKKQYPKLPFDSLLKMANYKSEWERDTERLKEKDVLNTIKKLDLPKTISDLFCKNEESKRIGLNNYLRCPTEFFLMTKKEQDAYNVENIIPFLSDISFYKIYAYDKKKNGFLTFDIEMPEPNINESSQRFTWDGLFVSDILFWWECEIENNKIIEFGKALQLNWTREIIDSIESKLDNSKTENITKWKNSIYKKYQMMKE